MKKLMATVSTGFLALLLPAVALAAEAGGTEEEKFDPSHEWVTKEWIPIHLGPIDLSITKTVAYLLLGALITCIVGILLMRVRLNVDPDKRQTAGEMLYDIAQTQIAEQGLPHRALARWFPYVASLFRFTTRMNRNIPMATRPNTPMLSSATAHGNRNAISRSKTMKRMATR